MTLTPEVMAQLVALHLSPAEAEEVAQVALSRPAAFADALNIAKGRTLSGGKEVARFLLQVARSVRDGTGVS